MMFETAEQRQQRVKKHLAEARKRIEEDITSTTDFTMKRIEADAAAVVTLSIIKELLPEQIREHVQAIIDVHEDVWKIDGPVMHGITPRKPLRERLLNKISIFMHATEGKFVHYKRSSSYLQ